MLITYNFIYQDSTWLHLRPCLSVAALQRCVQAQQLWSCDAGFRQCRHASEGACRVEDVMLHLFRHTNASEVVKLSCDSLLAAVNIYPMCTKPCNVLQVTEFRSF